MIASSLPSLVIRGRALLPIIQGGMGVGVSAHRLAGAVAKAVLTPWLRRYLKKEGRLCLKADPERGCSRQIDCLSRCGSRDGIAEACQFCIETQLAAAQRGDVERGLFFRGSEAMPFGHEVRSVRDLLQYLLTGKRMTPAA